MRKRGSNGFTMVEVITVMAMMAVVGAAALGLFRPIQNFFMKNSALEKTSMETRSAVDTITRELREGMANTVSICNCTTPNQFHYVACADPACAGAGISVAPPYSQIEFTLQGDTTQYAFYWANNTVQMYRNMTLSGVSYKSQTLLATSVNNLNFTQSASDPAVIYVTLTSSAPYDSTGSKRDMTGMTIDKEEVHMLAQQ